MLIQQFLLNRKDLGFCILPNMVLELDPRHGSHHSQIFSPIGCPTNAMNMKVT